MKKLFGCGVSFSVQKFKLNYIFGGIFPVLSLVQTSAKILFYGNFAISKWKQEDNNPFDLVDINFNEKWESVYI